MPDGKEPGLDHQPRQLLHLRAQQTGSRLEKLKNVCQRRYDMNVTFQMQGGKNWIFPK
jgi:hypothetical protein